MSSCCWSTVFFLAGVEDPDAAVDLLKPLGNVDANPCEPEENDAFFCACVCACLRAFSLSFAAVEKAMIIIPKTHGL